ncbi:hypothetical protein GIB67_033427 [Kingdonia uniflora]|uniref:F-box domain-containing protein n=1 Tax=Kingdonia uniflora TaxID=39325 RepID=A0A7J7LU43_9MAGN|nr:hypothetical protein GIB67_033427 [Kingdonia uniflora]
MDTTTSPFSLDFPFSSIFFAAFATAFSCFAVFRIIRHSSSSSIIRKESNGCECVCSCTNKGRMGESSAVVEGQTGASMMEQLVPEITTHTLSYLDFPSLCRLSMTNSAMRRAANDDNAWKALYRKDFTMEQGNVVPRDGWKAYYAATRAVVNVNAQFFNIIRENSLPAMRHFWLRADYVKCVHSTGELFTGILFGLNLPIAQFFNIIRENSPPAMRHFWLRADYVKCVHSTEEFFTGYDGVMQSWQMMFNWAQEAAFQVRDVRTRVLSDMAWVTMKTLKTFVDMETRPFHVTNIFEFQNGQWYMVHHHSTGMVVDMDMEHQNPLFL